MFLSCSKYAVLSPFDCPYALMSFAMMAAPLVGSPCTVGARTVARSSRALVGACVSLPPSVGAGSDIVSTLKSKSWSRYLWSSWSASIRVVSSHV